MTAPATVADRYIALWNETDADRRRGLLARDWSADATYVDPLMQAQGHDGVDGLVAGAQSRFPGFRFALDGPADGHGPHIRFSWTLGPAGVEGDAASVRGTDFVEIDPEGRLSRVTGFLDRVPA
ncbi:hypothetical protein PMI01_03377 [Caulobacter sp. AP07]|uniref:nuclear transport factor 2 family protein n=1 Tax=Caulobacter sp. AP07 TaxID=1144304 RepID=UPI000272206E|nr:nuclear transport factor 2 family protein [Caulobacter sp. AP07]EJL29216.1 hypothetical protein PMI01_03377 [Caulobacter sp. AP07]